MMMRRFPMIAALAMLAATPALAQGMDAGDCPSLGGMASTIMEARQEGFVMSDLMAIVDVAAPQSSDYTPEYHAIARSVVIDAYNQPAFRTPEHRARAIVDFRNSVEAICYSATQ